MPVARLFFTGYQSSNENGGGNHAWQNVAGAGASAFGAGAFDTRDPNSADMNWIRSQGDGARGSASIPPGSIITGIIVGFEAKQTGGAQTGGSCVCGIFKAGALVASKSVSLPQGASVGPFGASNDLWGLGALATPTYFTNMYFGLHLNFPTITADISMFAWNGYMDIYYNDPTPVPTSISVGGGNNQSAQVSTQFPLQLYAVVRDQGGNPMPGIGVTFTLPASGASAGFNSLGGPKTATATTNSSGGAVSPFFYANATSGNWQPVADVTGSSPLVFTLFNQTNTPVPPVLVPTTISKLQGDGQQAAVLTPFAVLQKVKVWDQFVHTMQNVEINWTVPGSGARGTYAGGTPAVSFTDAFGVATAPVLTANVTPGAWTQNTFPTGFAGVNAAFGFTNLANSSPPTATSLTVVTGNTQAAALSTNFPTAVVVRVSDQYGSAFPGASVTATIPTSSNGSFLTGGGQSKTVTSDSSGNATFGTIVAGGVVSAGWNMTVTCTGTGGTTVGAFRNVDASLATGLAVISGSAQIATPNTAFALPLRVRVTNGLGNGIQNYSTTFTAPGSSQSCTFPGSVSSIVVLTDVNGYAQTTATANANEGSYNVTVSASGLTSVLFAMQNGNTYGTEVCTTFDVGPGPNSNSTLGAVGTALNWSNVASANNTAAGGSFASNATAPPNSNRSNALLINMTAAALGIPNDARITKVNISYWVFVLSGGNGSGTIGVGFALNGAFKTTAQFSSSLIADTWTNLTRNITYGSSFMTGADLELANTGFTFNWAPSSTFTGTVRINGVTVQVCYQPLVPPPVQSAMGPLLMCEA